MDRQPTPVVIHEAAVALRPDLNLIGCVWGNLKSTELANLCSDTIDEVAHIAEGGLDRTGTDAVLCFAFLRHAK